MRPTPILLVLCLAACGPHAANVSNAPVETSRATNALTAAERASGWSMLFDGKTFAGWRGLGRDSVPSAHWKIVDGAIVKVASGAVPKQADGQPLEGGD